MANSYDSHYFWQLELMWTLIDYGSTRAMVNWYCSKTKEKSSENIYNLQYKKTWMKFLKKLLNFFSIFTWFDHLGTKRGKRRFQSWVLYWSNAWVVHCRREQLIECLAMIFGRILGKLHLDSKIIVRHCIVWWSKPCHCNWYVYKPVVTIQEGRRQNSTLKI